MQLPLKLVFPALIIHNIAKHLGDNVSAPRLGLEELSHVSMICRSANQALLLRQEYPIGFDDGL